MIQMQRQMKSYLGWIAVALSMFCWMPSLQAQQRGNLGNGGARGGGGGGGCGITTTGGAGGTGGRAEGRILRRHRVGGTDRAGVLP